LGDHADITNVFGFQKENLTTNGVAFGSGLATAG
jgi:hypothetical protein